MPKEQLYPRVNSTYKASIYNELIKISDNIDFSHHQFYNRQKRNRSLGSAQAFIVELALMDEQFMKKLRGYMIEGGRNYVQANVYINQYN
ncbi:hypothetical protein [Peribacillus frigoritolerans]|uniref:IDEAL domain-containing protein n=1 Tax=Peribacillus castrilensis TaxID=2897690 RepID=A0AAW9NMQ5_9BACI|nr:hypothetical protein [Peribacillus castrilensis]